MHVWVCVNVWVECISCVNCTGIGSYYKTKQRQPLYLTLTRISTSPGRDREHLLCRRRVLYNTRHEAKKGTPYMGAGIIKILKGVCCSALRFSFHPNINILPHTDNYTHTCSLYEHIGALLDRNFLSVSHLTYSLQYISWCVSLCTW